MTYQLTGMSSLGNVTSEDSTKDAQLFQMPIPMSPSSETFMLDLFGAIRTISIKGIFSGTTDEIESFILEFDNLISGIQGNNIYYHSDKSDKDYKVLIQNIRRTAEEGAPTMIGYSIEMIEGKA